MLDRLRLTLNAQFYRPRAGALTDQDVRALLDAAETNRDPERHPLLANELRVARQTASGVAYRASLRIFVTTRPVYFLDDEALEDQIHAYALVLEFDTHVAIFKKSCGDLSRAANRCLDLVSYTDLTRTIDDSRVAYQKLSARQMTVAETAIRVRGYEAADLKGTLSTFAAGRSVVRTLQLRDRGTVRTLNLSTARLVDTAERQTLDAATDWAANRLAVSQLRSDEFISRFARSVGLADVLVRARPNAILIDGSALVERLASEELHLHYTTRRGRLVPASSGALQTLLRLLESVYEIAADLKIVGAKARLKISPSALTFDAQALRRFKIMENGKPLTLQRFLIARNLYTVTFTLPTFVYTAGSCFEDRSSVADIPAVKAMLIPMDALRMANSEKGARERTRREFDGNSVFGIVERHHADESFLICDDLNDEWADHIALDVEQACITFIHSKHGDVSTSASNLHDVVGQAVKNLGNMAFDADLFLAKYGNKWRKDYVDTHIRRLRQGDGRQLRSGVVRLLADPRLHRKCIIACSFLSRRQLVTSLNRLERGEPVPGHFVQLFWILSSFAHAVREAGAVPVVYCQP